MAFSLALTLACATEPSESETSEDRSEKKRTILLSTEYDDLSAGEQAAREIEAEMGIYDAPELAAYISKIGRQLVRQAAPRPFQYEFYIVDQMAPNAFSLPGGHIYVSRGLIALAQDDDELANVLGHEIIHAAERHAAAQQELARRGNPFTMPFLRLARLASYSRDHERAADRGGQELAARAGYDPAGMSRFLTNLANAERLTIGYSRLSSYFDTHPGTTERVASTATLANTLEWARNPSRRTGRANYLRHIEGVILGTNPGEGVFRETEFIHPDMDFRILFPRGWTLINGHQAVGAISSDGSARIFITLEAPEQAEQEPGAEGERLQAENEHAPPRMPTPKQAAERLVANHGDEFDIRVQREQPVQLGDIETYRLDIHGRMGTAPVIGQISFIAHEGFVLRLTSVALSSAWPRYQGRIHTAARTFRPLTDEERNSVDVLHLGLVHALEDESIPSLSQRTQNTWRPGRTAVLNGVFVDSRFAAGQIVKIARSSRYQPRKPAPERISAEGDPGLVGPGPGAR
ncbi:MAG: M48 family metalloprotease [Myxococcota bacterium]|nr:M48 family metalloprotease [Myxococcota bacterium]